MPLAAGQNPISPPQALSDAGLVTVEKSLSASAVRRLAEVLTGVSWPKDVVPTAAEALRAEGLRYLLLRPGGETDPRWVTTLPDWVLPEAYAEHLALLAYGEKLREAAGLNLQWTEDVQADSHFLDTAPYAERLGFRGLAFCPAGEEVGGRGRPQRLVGFCWREAVERTAEGMDVLTGAAALIVTTYAATKSARLVQELESLPALDRVTHLPSVALMRELGPRLVSAADRRQEPLTCLLLRWVPTCAWGAEEVSAEAQRRLHTIAMTLAALTRGSDLVGHQADREFVALLPGATKEGAAEVAQRLTDGLAGLLEEVTPARRAQLIVGGVTKGKQTSLSYDSLLRLAQMAAQQAQTQGQTVLIADAADGSMVNCGDVGAGRDRCCSD